MKRVSSSCPRPRSSRTIWHLAPSPRKPPAAPDQKGTTPGSISTPIATEKISENLGKGCQGVYKKPEGLAQEVKPAFENLTSPTSREVRDLADKGQLSDVSTEDFQVLQDISRLARVNDICGFKWDSASTTLTPSACAGGRPTGGCAHSPSTTSASLSRSSILSAARPSTHRRIPMKRRPIARPLVSFFPLREA